METNFFSQLGPMIEGFDLQVTIKKTAGKLTLAVFSEPRIDDDARKRIPPLNFVATAKELDEHFFIEIQKPMSAISEFSLDMKKFETQMAATQADTQRARKTEDETRKKKADAKGKLDKGKELLEAGKPRQAISVFQEALIIYPGYPEATKLLIQAKSKAGLGAGLFDNIPEEQAAATEDATKTTATETQSTYLPGQPAQPDQPAQSTQPDQAHVAQGANMNEIASDHIFIESNTENHGSH